MHTYDTLFFDYIQAGSSRSARTVLPLVLANLPIHSVLDIGCGAGAWLREYLALGINDALGVDGDYVRPEQLLIPGERFLAHNLAQPFDLGRRFDLVQCLEVAEHLPAAHAGTLVDNLTRHSDYILFSAAVPGQGGEYHVNEQPYAYWRDLFAVRGYRLFDGLRPPLREHREVASWYRYNLLLFVQDSQIPQLPPAMMATRIADTAPIPDVAPLSDRLRRVIMRQLPPALLTRLAVIKHGWVLRRIRQRPAN